MIAWYLLISAFIGVLGLSVNPPVFFFGFFFKGTFASLIMFGLAFVQSLTAFGLLKLRPWGRTLAIYYFQFLIFNSLTMVLIPGTQARFDQAMGDMMRDMQGCVEPGAGDALSDLVWSDFRGSAAGVVALGGGQQERRLPGVGEAMARA